jgi:hypothetical protein
MGEMTRQAFVFTGAAAAAGVGLGFAFDKYGPGEVIPRSTNLTALRIREEVSLDVDGPGWSNAEPISVALKPQQAAQPKLETPSLDEMVVAAVYNDRELGVLTRFPSNAPQDLAGLGQFGDAVALQLPLRGTAAPPITMGGPGQPVHILRWTSVWQRDVDRGRSHVEAVYPNVVRDVAPQTILPPKSAVLYSPGLAVRNTASVPKHEQPIEEAFAEGFGSITPLPSNGARARGRHRDGHWEVVMTVPLKRAPHGDSIERGATVPIAFALWLGAAGNRGSRKHFADWVQCTLA